MYLSKQQGHSVSVQSVNTIASGLAPPYAGKEDCEPNFQGLCSKIAQTILCNTSMPHIAHGYLDMSVHCALRTVSLPSSVLSLFSVLYTSSPAPPTSRSYELFKFTTRSFPLLPPLGLSLPYLTSQQAGKKKGDHNVCLSRQSANLQRT